MALLYNSRLYYITIFHPGSELCKWRPVRANYCPNLSYSGLTCADGDLQQTGHH